MSDEPQSDRPLKSRTQHGMLQASSVPIYFTRTFRSDLVGRTFCYHIDDIIGWFTVIHFICPEIDPVVWIRISKPSSRDGFYGLGPFLNWCELCVTVKRITS